MCDASPLFSASSWYFMDLWRNFMLSFAAFSALQPLDTHNKHMMMSKHDVRMEKYWKENLINFRNTRRARSGRTEKKLRLGRMVGGRAEKKKKSWRKSDTQEGKKKSWIDWYFAIKLFIFFNHLVMERAAKLLGRGWTARILLTPPPPPATHPRQEKRRRGKRRNIEAKMI